MDRTAGIKGRGRCRCRRHVYLAFSGAVFHCQNGRTGAGAQCIGRGDKESAHKYAQTAMQLSLYMGLLFAVFSLVFVHQMVGFFNLTDVEAYDAAISYTRIACGLIVFSFMTMTLTGVYTAQGDSKTPFLANLVGLVTNMILDPLLILGPGPLPKLGVSGAAIATVTAQFIVMSIMVLDII